MKKVRRTIVISITIIAILIVAIYLINFIDYTVSDNPYDWSSFASYFSGLMTPILSFVNILVILGLGKVVKDLGNEKQKHQAILSEYNNNSEWGDLKLKITPNATAEDNINSLHECLKRIEEQFRLFNNSDEECEKDLFDLARKAKLSRKAIQALHDVPYYENPFVNRMWELHNIGSNNIMAESKITLLQLKVNVYELMYKSEPDNEVIHNKYLEAQKELENYHKDSVLVD